MILFWLMSFLLSMSVFAQSTSTEMEISYYPAVDNSQVMREEKVYNVVNGKREKVIAEKTFVNSTNELVLISFSHKSYVPIEKDYSKVLADVENAFKSVKKTYKQISEASVNFSGLDNCSKDDSSKTISCPDGLYKKDGSTVDSLRQVVEKNQSSEKKPSQKNDSQAVSQ